MTKDEINHYLAEAEYEYTETGTSPISDDVYDALARSVDRKVVGAAVNHRDLLTHDAARQRDEGISA
jgi:NAD-dependent DNA ligase